MAESSHAVVVLGMHRSGTSLAMAGLESLGVDTGGHLIEPGADNKLGYWEDGAILGVNERLLAALGKGWSSVAPITDAEWARVGVDQLRREAVGLLRDRFAGSPLWGFKDPRTLRLLPFWRNALHEVAGDTRYVVTFRHPESVAASLAYRNRFSRAKSYCLWLGHYVPELASLLCEKCLFVNYDRFIEEPEHTMAALARFVHGTRDLDRDDTRISDFLDRTVQRGLRHTRFDEDAVDVAAPPIVKQLFAMLDRFALDGPAASDARKVKALQTRYASHALLLRQIDSCEIEAKRLTDLVAEQEPIREKIHKMGLYQADVHSKVERMEATLLAEATNRIQAQDKLVEAVAARIDASREQAQDELVGAVAARIDALLAASARAQKKITSTLTDRLDTLDRYGGQQASALETLDNRVEDIQEKVVVQIDELHRTIFGELLSAERDPKRMQQLQRELTTVREQLQLVYASTSWRVTGPVRAVKMFAARQLARFRH